MTDTEVEALLDPEQRVLDGEDEFPTRRNWFSTNMPSLSRYFDCSRGCTTSSLVLAAIGLVLLSGGLFAVWHGRSTQKFRLGNGEPWTDIQLPPVAKPSEYRLDFMTWLEPDFKFVGSVEIDLHILEDTKFLALHALELSMNDPRVLTTHGLLYPVANASHAANQMTTFHFAKPFLKGQNVTLFVNFKGNIGEAMVGYYRSSYHDKDGNLQFLASTQFEATDARRAFPCLDEPGLKARFLVNATVQAPLKAISNMAASSVIPLTLRGERGWRKFVFPATPPMCTYLVAWVVSEFESISGKTARGTHINIWTQPDKTRLGKYALQVSIACLEYYEALFEIDYPLDKLDHVAIPSFSSAAMENYGLCTYRETALLYDPDLSSALDRQRVASVIAHEISHQYFGDAVSIASWSSLVLNEGFAEFVEYIGAEAAARADGEEWRMQDQFYSNDMTPALNADASSFTHAITGNVENPAEIEEIFDAISYSKGASLLRMLRAWVNSVESEVDAQRRRKQKPIDVPDRDRFFSRITSYLNKYQFSNADTKDLWDAIEVYDEHGKPTMGIDETMSTWTDQPGYPVVILTPTNDGMMVRQERFMYSHWTKSEQVRRMETNQTWWIPFTYMIYTNDTSDGMPVAHSGPYTVLLTETETLVPQVLHGFANPNNPTAYYFVKANVNQSAPYRVLYPETDISVVADWVGLRFFLPPVGRAGFVSDCVNMALSGRLGKIEPVLDLMDQLLRPLAAEDEYVVWVTVIDLLNRLFLHGAYEIHPSYGDLADWMQKLVSPAVKAIGWDHVPEEAYLRRLLRTELLKFAVQVGEPQTVSTARRLFKDISSGYVEVYSLPTRNRRFGFDEQLGLPIGPNSKPVLAPDILDTIYDAEMIHGGDMASYEALLAMWRDASFAVEKQRLLHALCNAKPLWLVRRNLDFILSHEVKLQDTFSALKWTTHSSYAANQEAWTYFRDNWDTLSSSFRDSLGQQFGAVINTVAATMGSEPLLQDMELWFKAQLGPCDPHDEDDVDCRRTLPPMSGRSVRKGAEIARTKINFVNVFGHDIWTWMKDND